MYMVFNKMRFKELKAANPDMPFTEVSKQISNEYKLLSDEDKKKYQLEADEQNKQKQLEFDKAPSPEPKPSSKVLSQPDSVSGAPEKEKKPMSPFMFYMQVRRAELRDPAHVSPDKAPSITEVTKIVSNEWKQLDDFKKQ